MLVKRYCNPCGERDRRPVEATWIVAGEYMCDTHAAQQPAGLKKVSLTKFEPKNANPYNIPVEGKRAPITKLPKPINADGLCSRGCGRPTHRGWCKGMNGKTGLMTKPVPMPQPLPPPRSRLPVVVSGSEIKMPFTFENVAQPKTIEGIMTSQIRVRSGLLPLESKTISIAEIPAVAAPRQKKLGRQGELWAKLEALAPGQAEAVENRDWTHATTTLNHILKKARDFKRTLNHKRSGNLLYLWLEPKTDA